MKLCLKKHLKKPLKKHHFIVILSLTFLVGSMLSIAQEPPPTEGATIQIARLIYKDKQKTKCFSNAFLFATNRESNLKVDTKFYDVRVESDELFNYPMVLWYGEGSFNLTTKQIKNLNTYLMRGGTILVSSSCNDKKWNASFEAAILKTLPKHKLKELPMSHPLFSTVYQIKRIECTRKKDSKLLGITIDGRLAVIFCPEDLRASQNLGGDCCCCGANYVRNATQINTNILTYVVTH